MKTYDIRPEQTDEDLIQTMEALLDQADPDQEAIRAVLAELDRRSGGTPFDTQAGWADLQARRRENTAPRRRKLHRFPIAIAAVLVCLVVSVTAIGGHWGLHEKTMDYFGITEETSPLIQDASILTNCSVTKHGGTVTVKQTIADANSVFVLFELETPEDIPLDADTYFFWDEGPWLTVYADGKEINCSGGGGLLEVTDEHHALFCISAYSAAETLKPGQLKLEVQGLSYHKEDPDTGESQKIQILDDTWKLKWEMTTIEAGKTIAVETPVLWNGFSYDFDQICLTPLSLRVSGSYGTEGVDDLPFHGLPPASLVFQDGTMLPLGGDDSVVTHFESGASFNGENYTLHINAQFAQILDPDRVVGVQLGDALYSFS